MNRHSIVTRIFFPFALTTLMFAIVLLGVVPDRQAKILAANTENELFSIAKTIALSVNIALKEENLEAPHDTSSERRNEKDNSMRDFVKEMVKFELMLKPTFLLIGMTQ